jgi:hypothetical protein
MAEIRLWNNPRDTVIRDLPRVCMKCGADATTSKEKKFSWYPPWIILLIFLGVWPFLIVALILTKWKRVEMQFCDQHKHHYLIRSLIGLGGVLGLLAIGLLAFMVAVNSQPGNQGNDLFPFLCLGWFVALLIFAVTMSVVTRVTTIRPTEITDRDIRLKNVSPEFVRAMEEEEAELERDIDRDVRDRWRENRRRERRVDDDRYERRGDRPPPKPATDITEEEAE